MVQCTPKLRWYPSRISERNRGCEGDLKPAQGALPMFQKTLPSPQEADKSQIQCVLRALGFSFLGQSFLPPFVGKDIQRERKKEPILLKYLKQASDLQTDPGIPQQRPQQRPSILLIPTLFPTAALSASVDLPVNTPRF